MPVVGEVDGKDYHFLDRSVFRDLIASGGLVEHQEVHGNWLVRYRLWLLLVLLRLVHTSHSTWVLRTLRGDDHGQGECHTPRSSQTYCP